MDKNGAERMAETIIGYSVRVLILAAACIVGVGAKLYLGRHSLDAVPAYSVFKSEPVAFRGVAAIIKYALTCDGRGLIQLGILLLIAIPVVRVAFFAASFALRRDWLYCIITGIVCAVLLFSFIGGKL